MARIIVDFPDNANPALVLKLVRQVVLEGRISQAAGIPQYCWVTAFGGTNLVVCTRRKRKGQLSDSFVVREKI